MLTSPRFEYIKCIIEHNSQIGNLNLIWMLQGQMRHTCTYPVQSMMKESEVEVYFNYCNFKQSYYSTFLFLVSGPLLQSFCGGARPARQGNGSICEKK